MSDEFIDGMRSSGTRLSTIFKALEKYLIENIDKNISKNDINEFLIGQTEQQGAKPLFLGHQGYPKESIVCINEEIVHAIPDDRIIKKTDLLTVDLAISFNGFCADSARTYSFAENSDHNKLIQATKEAFDEAVKIIKAGIDIFVVGKAIQAVAKKYKLTVVKDLTGHGIGKKMWEDPYIFNFPFDHYKLSEGKCIAIEPIFAFGNGQIKTLKDEWTIVSIDKRLSAHYENTILVTRSGCEVLT